MTNTPTTDPVTRAETELTTRLTAHIPDEQWRAQLAARFIHDLLSQGWKPPTRPPDELAAKRNAQPPNDDWRQARAELAARTREEQNQ